MSGVIGDAAFRLDFSVVGETLHEAESLEGLSKLSRHTGIIVSQRFEEMFSGHKGMFTEIDSPYQAKELASLEAKFLKWHNTFSNNKTLVVFYNFLIYDNDFVHFFQLAETRLAELINNKVMGETKRRLINDIVVVSKTMNLDYQLGWKIRRDIRRIVDQSQKVISPRNFIEAKLKNLFKNKFYSKLPGFSWRFYEYIVPAELRKANFKGTRPCREIVLRKSN